MSTFLSFDYDFLIRHGMYEDVEFPNGEKVPGMIVYDWQMDEGRGPMLDQLVWENRVQNFMRYGLDMRALTAPEISIEDFAQQVTMRMGDYTSPMMWRGDSHAWAGILARDLAKQFGPLDVVNFDAHHDLGYANNYKPGEIHCDNWAKYGLGQGWISNYTVVYPDWLGKKEYGPEIRKKMKGEKRVQVTTWSKWLESTDEISEVEAAFFCRSSSWVPPFHDEGFQKLHEEFGYAECLDCEHGQHASPYDTCQPRHWDWDELQSMYEQREANYETLAKLTQG